MKNRNLDFQATIDFDIEDSSDTVTCGWCDEEYPIEECRRERKLGYLCPYCQQEIKSHGEPLHFVHIA